jgi:hypothetical protein
VIVAPAAPERPSAPLAGPVGGNAFARLPEGLSVSETLQEAKNAVVSALRVDPTYVCWVHVPALRSEALVVHTPWSRVVVARTAGGAHRVAADWRQGRCSWLLDALHEQYPVEATPPLPLARLTELPTDDPTVASFVRWATQPGRVGWRALPDTQVIGSWRSYREAVVVRRGNLFSVRMR